MPDDSQAVLPNATLRRLLELARQPDVTVEQVESVVAADPGFAQLLVEAGDLSPRDAVTLGLTVRPDTDDFSLLAELHGELGRRWLANRERVAELERQAVRDPLTGVGSRSFFEAELARAVSEARRHRQPVGLLFLDADRFKAVNDTHGHLAGDDLLRRLAGALARSVRGSDVLARFGGDEFVVLVSRSNAAGLRVLAERVVATVSATAFAWQERTLPLTVSVGAATGIPDDEDFAKCLLAAADHAVLQVKRAGGNGCVFRSL